MKTLSMDSVMVSGVVAALLAAGGGRAARAQGASAGPERQIKDTAVVRLKVMRISVDSLVRAIDAVPLWTKESERMRQELEQKVVELQMAFGNTGQRIIFTTPGGPGAFKMLPKGWIGITTAGVHHDWTSDGHLVQYLDYPPIVSVDRPSPAQTAGILPGDTLVAYDGIDVVAHPVNVTRLLIPEKRIAVTVRRDGENRAFMLVVGRPPNAAFVRGFIPGDGPDGPFPPFFPTGEPSTRIVPDGFRGRGPASGQVFIFTTGVFGANLSSVNADLARKLKIEVGVLVNEVPDGTPAARAGLEAGDVIVNVDGQPVSTVDGLRKLAMLHGESPENRGVTLQVIRDKKTRSITVK
jgi:membrane-associated protease RseP (regulator of RpoE activity)